MHTGTMTLATLCKRRQTMRSDLLTSDLGFILSTMLERSD